MLFEERGVPLEANSPFGFAEQSEELLGAVAERVQNAVQLARSELLGARNRRDIANQLLKLVVAHADAEVSSRDVFDLVRFVENHRGVLRDDAAEILVLHRQVREEQVMIDDDDVALVRALVHLRDEAALELLALLSRAKLAPRIDLVPGRTRLGQRLDLRAVAGGGASFPTRE